MTPEKLAPAATAARPTDSAAQSSASETAAFLPETSVETPLPGSGTAAQDLVGKALGKYQVTGVLGQGGMGVVLRAHDPLIERDVAIKILAGHLAADATSLDRFLSEAKAAGKLSHPNVVAIYEICHEGPIRFLVLEYVPGGSLSDRLAGEQPLPVLEATQALIDACKGVGAAHAAGLIHRDIKPANFMRAADGSVKVGDFGLAKAAAGNSRQFTQTGVLVGTPYYMSPEQCEAKPLDHRSDLYSLGATYYSLLTGKQPYQDTDSVPQLMYAHCHAPAPDPHIINPALPEACCRVIARAMAKAPADRYQSTTEMLADLQAVAATLSGQTRISLPSDSTTNAGTAAAFSAGSPRRRRRTSTIGGLALLVLVALGVFAVQPWRKSSVSSPGASAALPVGAESVKVGVLHSLSGTMAASESPVVDAIVFALDEINQAGGVLGRPIKPVVADGRSDGETFAREAERLITQEHVSAVFGCWTSASRKTVQPVFEEHDHLLLYPVQFEGLEASPCIVYLGAVPNQQILPAVKWAVESLHKRRFFLVGSDYVFPRAAHAIINDSLKDMDAEVVGEAYVPLGSQKVEGVLNAIIHAKPDMILNTINGDSNIAFFRALRAAGIHSAETPTLSFSIDEQGLRSLSLADMVGDYAAWTYFQSVATPENEQFVRQFHDKYPQRSITDPMETAYLAVKLWAKAANDAQSVDPKTIRRAMLNLRLKGPEGEVRIDPDTQYCFRRPRVGAIEADGQFKVVWTAEEPIRPEPYPATRTAEAWRAFLHDLYRGWGNRWAAPEADLP